ncbi:MAG TPA: hypothetical protein VFI76_03320 [Terrimicrobiaceae bacterium]|nr:hypothetical protein [Terrimicrobiaceae bacterium]
MNSAFSLWQLGLGLLVTTVAFGFSVKAASRYSHSGIALLCASLGIEALAGLLAFLMFALDPGKFSFLLWASGILRYLGLGLLLAGWILLATSRNAIAERQTNAASSAPPMISGASFVRWAIVGVLVVSGLAAAWALLLLFAAGMKTVPSFTSEEAFSAVLPSLVLLPCSIGLTVLSVHWSAGRVFVGLGIFSGVINLGCILIAIITHGSR